MRSSCWRSRWALCSWDNADIRLKGVLVFGACEVDLRAILTSLAVDGALVVEFGIATTAAVAMSVAGHFVVMCLLHTGCVRGA